MDDFEGVDIEDNAVVSLFGAPWEMDPYGLFGYDMAIGNSVHVAVRQGGLLVYVTEDLASGLKATPITEEDILAINEISSNFVGAINPYMGEHSSLTWMSQVK